MKAKQLCKQRRNCAVNFNVLLTRSCDIIQRNECCNTCNLLATKKSSRKEVARYNTRFCWQTHSQNCEVLVSMNPINTRSHLLTLGTARMTPQITDILYLVLFQSISNGYDSKTITSSILLTHNNATEMHSSKWRRQTVHSRHPYRLCGDW